MWHFVVFGGFERPRWAHFVYSGGGSKRSLGGEDKAEGKPDRFTWRAGAKLSRNQHSLAACIGKLLTES